MKDLYPEHFVYDFRNIFGYQLYRIVTTPSLSHEAPFRDIVDQEKGFNITHDILSKEDFSKLYSFYRSKIDFSAVESRVPISPNDKDYNNILSLFDVPELKKILIRRPLIEFERINITDVDVDDQNKRWHSDRFVDCHKMFFFLNDHTKENGTYEYSQGSSKHSLVRYIWEYYTSLRYLLSRLSRGIVETYPILLSKLIAEIVHKRTVMNFPANTLVISNNNGFHRRGVISPGHTREQINFVFYYQ